MIKTIDDYLSAAEKHGLIFLDKKETLSTCKKFKWECLNGHIWEANFNTVKNSKGCIFCNKKYTEKDYIETAEIHNIIYQGPFPKTSHHKTTWTCKCGNNFDQCLKQIRGGWDSCKKCNGFITIEDYIKIGKEKGFILKDENIVINKGSQKVVWICENGHEYLASYFYMKDLKRCIYCSGKYDRTLKDYIFIAEQKGIKFVDEIPSNTDTVSKWECRCGKEFFRSYYYINKGTGLCSDCADKFYPELKTEMEGRGKHQICERYDEWRFFIYKRDNYTCKCCNSKRESKNQINAHHILNWKSYKDLRFEINNGITLCQKCHKKFHSIYKNSNNTLEQIEEFIGRQINEIDREFLLNQQINKLRL